MTSWTPLRWPDEWLDPKTLALLEGSPINSIVVSSASHPIVAEAKKRKIAVIGLSKDNAVQEDVTVPAYGATYMDPKGIHIYLSDLKKELKEGDTVHMTLKTELGIPIEVDAPVKK